ncbi:hypothetical protein Cni_G01781 [Canna indica]|uniref:Uncharacterized protein n=1 Tax=Canna indica TaxID=4628 RepID=A0AAQ3JPT6_9LILI|nr:hypothetical protein Cni_G01781 [Canna indica]
MLLNNIAKIFNEFILEARDKPILTMCEMIRRMLVKRLVAKKKGMMNYPGPITPHVQLKLESAKKDAPLSIIACYGNLLFEANHVREHAVVGNGNLLAFHVGMQFLAKKIGHMRIMHPLVLQRVMYCQGNQENKERGQHMNLSILTRLLEEDKHLSVGIVDNHGIIVEDANHHLQSGQTPTRQGEGERLHLHLNHHQLHLSASLSHIQLGQSACLSHLQVS